MRIREGRLEDAVEIASLLSQLDYPCTADFVERKLLRLMNHPDALIIVAVDDENALVGFVSLHFIPQIALAGDFCRISYFCVSQQQRSLGIGRRLEAEIVRIAKVRGCDRIEVHCHIRRQRAHGFYAKQGYQENPKYLLKMLTASDSPTDS